MITALLFAGSAVSAWIGTHLGPSEENDWANTSGLPAFFLSALLFGWACVRIFA